MGDVAGTRAGGERVWKRMVGYLSTDETRFTKPCMRHTAPRFHIWVETAPPLQPQIPSLLKLAQPQLEEQGIRGYRVQGCGMQGCGMQGCEVQRVGTTATAAATAATNVAEAAATVTPDTAAAVAAAAAAATAATNVSDAAATVTPDTADAAATVGGT